MLKQETINDVSNVWKENIKSYYTLMFIQIDDILESSFQSKNKMNGGIALY